MKEEVLRDLTRTVYSAEKDQQEIFTRLLQREKESSTFFNEGVAFPHLRLEDDSLPRIALGIIPKGIADVSTIEPIRLVFLIVTSAAPERRPGKAAGRRQQDRQQQAPGGYPACREKSRKGHRGN